MKVELVKELESFNQELKNKTSVQLQQFEVEALKYDQKLKRHQSQNIQNYLLIKKMQQVFYQYNNEIQNLQTALNTNSILQRLEILRLTNLLNQNLKDLENYDIQLINCFEEQNKIVKYQDLLSRLSDQAVQIKNRSEISQHNLLQQLNQYCNISQQAQNQIEIFKSDYEKLDQEYLNQMNQLKQQNFEISLQNLEQQVHQYKILITIFQDKFDEKEEIALRLLKFLGDSNQIKNERSKQLQSFLLEIRQLKEVIKNLGFNQNFEIYYLIIKYKQQNEEKLEQLKQYVQQCFKCFRQNQEIYHKLKKNMQAKKEFYFQCTEINMYLDQLQNLSQEKIKQLQNLQIYISEQQKKINFEGSQEEYQVVYEYWEKSQETQLLLEKLHEQALDSFQRSQTDLNYSQDFISKYECLGKIKQELQAIKKNQIKKYNECLKQNFESFVLQIYVITIFSIYKTNEYYIRKVCLSQSAEEKRKNEEELDKEKEKQAILKAEFKKYLDDIDSIQFWKSGFQELIEEQNQIEQRQKRLFSEINTRSKVKLRAQIKDQQIIKEIIELEEYYDFNNIIIFSKKMIQL